MWSGVGRVAQWRSVEPCSAASARPMTMSVRHILAAALLLAVCALFAATSVAQAAGGPAALGELPYQTLLPHQLDDRGSLLVNVANGDVVLQSEDLNIAGTQLPLSVTRYFNDQSAVVGLAGHGQTLSGGPDVHVTANADGSATYQGPSGFQVKFPGDGKGGYTTPSSYTEALLAKASGGGWTLTLHKTGEVYSFNAAGNQTSDATATGEAVKYAYNGEGKLSTITDTQGRVVTFTYFANQYSWEIADSTGRKIRYYDNSKGQLTDVYDGGPNEYWGFKYSTAGDLTSITDPMGDKTALAYNGSHQVTSITYPGTLKYTYTYNSGNTVVADPKGHGTTYDYDGSGRVTKIIDADGNSHGTSWDGNNNTTSVTSPAGGITKLSYDSLNNLSTLQNPNLPNGASGAVTSYSYGNAAHPYSATSSTDTQGNQTSYSYDTSGNLSAATNTSSGGSGMGNAVVSIQGDPTEEGGIANCGGQVGEVCSTTNAKGNLTNYAYDAKGNLTSITPPGGVGKETIGYDGLSRPTSITGGSGNTETISYDTDDRPVEVKSPDVDVKYSYDYNGNVTYIEDNGVTSEYYYDADNRLDEMQQSNTWITYKYDKANNLESETEPSGKTTYIYDAANYVTKVENSSSKTSVGLAYSGGRPSTITLPGGITETIGYDQNGRETSIKAVKGSTMLTNYSGTFTNSAGKDTGLLQAETNGVTGATTSYAYDGLNRLASATQAGPGPLNSYSYTYDLDGNVTQVTHNGVAGPSLGYNANDELATVNGSPAGSYDLSGNQTSTRSGLALTYNTDGQTSSFTPSGGSATTLGYASNQQGLRTHVGSTTEVNGLLGLYSDASGGETTYFTHLPNGTGQTIGETIGKVSYFYLPDLQGSTVAVTDNGGAIRDTYAYDPYGNTLSSTGAVPNPWRFDDGYYESGSGLYKFGERYYNPSDNRWTQLDPSGQNPGYIFTDDNPVNEADPTGTLGSLRDVLKEAALGCGIGAAGGAFIVGAAATAETGITPAAAGIYIAGSCLSEADAGGLDALLGKHAGDPLRWYEEVRTFYEFAPF
jgi:RHS repeat-associated protein